MNVKLGFVGDIYIDGANIPNKSFNIKEAFNVDYLSGNLEAPLKGRKIVHKVGPILAHELDSIKKIKDLKFDFLSLANNHILDQGESGVIRTLKSLDKLGIAYSGVYSINNTFLYHKEHLAGQNIYYVSVAEKDSSYMYSRTYFHYILEDKAILHFIKSVKRSDKSSRIILLSHGGIEEVPLPTKRQVKKYRRFIDLGVDLIVGSHPHVVQGWEKYRGGYIFYSLGNYAFTGSDDVYPSFGSLMTIELDEKGFHTPRMTYQKNMTYNKTQRHNFSKYISLSNKLLASEYIFEIISSQNLSLLKLRYMSMILSYLNILFHIDLRKLHLRFNWSLFKLIKLFIVNPSHREVLFSFLTPPKRTEFQDYSALLSLMRKL